MKRQIIVSGVVLTAFYTFLISGADAITKQFSASYAAPQLFALSGGIVALLCVIANRRNGRRVSMATTCPRAMSIRAAATVGAAVAFFHAFRALEFAEVFLFIAAIPLLAALMSGPVLGERVRPQAWAALLFGVVGVACLFPTGWNGVGAGHLLAFIAVLLGTVSMVASRYIGKREDNILAQVFYPNLALMAVMAVALPSVYKPMALSDLVWAVVYAVMLFGARWVLVAALRALPAYVVTPLMNLQFLWMVLIGMAIFAETPGANVYLGAFIIIAAGIWLLHDQIRGARGAKAAVPAE